MEARLTPSANQWQGQTAERNGQRMGGRP